MRTTSMRLLCLLACISFIFVGCQKTEPQEVTSSLQEAASLQEEAPVEQEIASKIPLPRNKPIDKYTKQEVVEEVLPLVEAFVAAQYTYAMDISKAPTWDQYLLSKDEELAQDIAYYKTYYSPTPIFAYEGEFLADEYTKVEFKEQKWILTDVLQKFHIYYGEKNDPATIVSKGGHNYYFELLKDAEGYWKIVRWHDENNVIAPFLGRGSVAYAKAHNIIPRQPSNPQPQVQRYGTSGYNGQAAANYALRHWNNPNPNWCDYTNQGGDCTNFVSQCLLAGGWRQKTGSYCSSSSWFHNGKGKCWNTPSVKNYSCSWTQARDFYSYLQASRSASHTHMAYSSIYPRVGDVIQLSSGGEARHTMIVTRVENGVPYVTYRNAAGYRADYDVEIKDYAILQRATYWHINGVN